MTNRLENAAPQLATSLSDMILLSGHEAVDGSLGILWVGQDCRPQQRAQFQRNL